MENRKRKPTQATLLSFVKKGRIERSDTTCKEVNTDKGNNSEVNETSLHKCKEIAECSSSEARCETITNSGKIILLKLLISFA